MKTFKTIDEQLQLLIDRKLVKKEELDERTNNKYRWYLSNFNYHNLVNGFNDPFFKDGGEENHLYRDNANFQMFIDLFNFDRKISKLVLNEIQSIERRINSGLVYWTLILNNVDDGLLFNLDDEIIRKNIFNNPHNNHNFNYKNFKDSLFEQVLTKDFCRRFISEGRNINNIPLWVMCSTWNFSTTINFFEYSDIDVTTKVLEQMQPQNRSIKLSENIDFFRNLLLLFLDVRNTICHNNTLYNTKYTKNNWSLNWGYNSYIKAIKSKNSKITFSNLIDFLTLFNPDCKIKEFINGDIEKLAFPSDIKNKLKYIIMGFEPSDSLKKKYIEKFLIWFSAKNENNSKQAFMKNIKENRREIYEFDNVTFSKNEIIKYIKGHSRWNKYFG